MSEHLGLFEIVFRGDIAAGSTLPDVKARLGELFKADPARVERMFTGRPVVIGSGLDAAKVSRYQTALIKAGALVEVRAVLGQLDGNSANVATKPVTVAPPVADGSGAVGGGWAVAATGADVLSVTEKRELSAREVDTGSLCLTPNGSDVLTPAERIVIEDRDVDTGDLALDD